MTCDGRLARFAPASPFTRSVRATADERTRRLPGDALIDGPLASLTHAISIRRPPRDVWPWLAQMGAGRRAGWYSYDLLDNGRRPSARQIVPALQDIAVGTLFPAAPGATDAFTVLAFERDRFLVIGWQPPARPPVVTWAFVLEPLPDEGTRLIVRVRAAADYQFRGLPAWLTTRLVPTVHAAMQRKQLLGIAERAEARAASLAPSRSVLSWTAAAAAVAAGGYAAWVAAAWYRYGRVPYAGRTDDQDDLLDWCMPHYEVRTRHRMRVAAPASATLAAARQIDLLHSPVALALIRARELILGARPDRRPRPRGLLAEAQSLGWGVLAERPDREIVMGAVTQPWKANVVFRTLPAEAFRAFDEPGWVKIAWTLRAEPTGPSSSVFSTETRVVTTDAGARARFRRYWALFSPGMLLIRWAALRALGRLGR